MEVIFDNRFESLLKFISFESFDSLKREVVVNRFGEPIA